MTLMDNLQQITTNLLVAYWQCPRKAFHLLKTTHEDLGKVKGIGEKKLEKIRLLVRAK